MQYGICPDVTYCEVGGHLIFLDTAKDQYFRLDSTTERSLRDHLRDGAPLSSNLAPFVTSGFLTEQGDAAHPSSIPIERPLASAIECSQSNDERLSTRTFIEVIWTVARMKRRLEKHQFKSVLEGELVYRRAHPSARASTSRPLEALAIQASNQFLTARRYVPIEPRCLLDSLCLLHFLSRRSLPARVIFGVTLEPFAAHCWVQTGRVALNETLGIANAHTPIRSV